LSSSGTIMFHAVNDTVAAAKPSDSDTGAATSANASLVTVIYFRDCAGEKQDLPRGKRIQLEGKNRPKGERGRGVAGGRRGDNTGNTSNSVACNAQNERLLSDWYGTCALEMEDYHFQALLSVVVVSQCQVRKNAPL